MSARIAVVGSNMIDLITYVIRMPEAGETIAAPRFEMGFGGKGANQAVAAARLGSQVMMVTRVGDDTFGKSYLENFRAQGIDVRHAAPAPGLSNGVAPIFVDPSGENRILIVQGANEQLSPADVDRAADDLLACDLILLQLEVPLETVYHTVALAARHGKEVLLNPAPAHPELEVGRLQGLTFLVPNQTELALLSGLPTGTVAQNEAAARSLIARGIRTVIVTLGGDGALLVDGRRDAARAGGAGGAGGHHRRRRRLHRQLRPPLRRGPRPAPRAGGGGPLRRPLHHPPRHAEVLRHRRRVPRLLRRPGEGVAAHSLAACRVTAVPPVALLRRPGTPQHQAAMHCFSGPESTRVAPAGTATGTQAVSVSLRYCDRDERSRSARRGGAPTLAPTEGRISLAEGMIQGPVCENRRSGRLRGPG